MPDSTLTSAAVASCRFRPKERRTKITADQTHTFEQVSASENTGLYPSSDPVTITFCEVESAAVASVVAKSQYNAVFVGNLHDVAVGSRTRNIVSQSTMISAASHTLTHYEPHRSAAVAKRSADSILFARDTYRS